MYPVAVPDAKPWKTSVTIDEHDLLMKVDKGASVTVIREATYNLVCSVSTPSRLRPCDVKLCTYTGEQIPVVGGLSAKVQCQEQVNQLPLVVVA